jgi:hypothetical protein
MKKVLTKLALAATIVFGSAAHAGAVPQGGNCAGWFAFTEGVKAYEGVINGSPQNPDGITHFNCTFVGTPPAGIKLTGPERWIFVPNKDGAKVSGMPGYVAVSDRTLNAASCTHDSEGAAITTPAGLQVIKAQAKKTDCK